MRQFCGRRDCTYTEFGTTILSEGLPLGNTTLVCQGSPVLRYSKQAPVNVANDVLMLSVTPPAGAVRKQFIPIA